MANSIFDTVNVSSVKRAAEPVPFSAKIINIWSIRPRSSLIGKNNDDQFYHVHSSIVDKFSKEKYNLVFFSNAFNPGREDSDRDLYDSEYPQQYNVAERSYSFVMVYVHVSKLTRNRLGSELFKSEWVEFYVPMGLSTRIYSKDGVVEAISALDHIPEDEAKVFICPEYASGTRRIRTDSNGKLCYHGLDEETIECLKGAKEVKHIAASWSIDTDDVSFKLSGLTFSKDTGLKTFNGVLYDSFINISASSSYLRGSHTEREWFHYVKNIKDPAIRSQLTFLDECDSLVSVDSFFTLLKETVKVISESRILKYTDEEIEARFNTCLLGSFVENGVKYEVAKPNWLYDEDEVSATLLSALHAHINSICYFEASQYESVKKNIEVFNSEVHNGLKHLFRNPIGASNIVRVDAENNRHIVLPSDWLEIEVPRNTEFHQKSVREIDELLVKSYINFSGPIVRGASEILFNTYTPIINFSGEMIPYSTINKLKSAMDTSEVTCGAFIRMGMLSSDQTMFMNVCGHTRSSTSLVLEANDCVRNNLNSSMYEIILKDEEERNVSCLYSSKNMGLVSVSRDLHKRELSNSYITRLALAGRGGSTSVNNVVALVRELDEAKIQYPEHLYVKSINAKTSDSVLIEFNRPLTLRGFFLERMANALGVPGDTMFELHEDLVPTKIERITKIVARIASNDHGLVIRSLERASPAPSTEDPLISHPNIGSNQNVCSGEVSNSDLQTFLETLEVINFDSSYNYNLFESKVCPVRHFVRDYPSSGTEEAKERFKTFLLGLMEDAGVTFDSFYEATVRQNAEEEETDEMDVEEDFGEFVADED